MLSELGDPSPKYYIDSVKKANLLVDGVCFNHISTIHASSDGNSFACCRAAKTSAAFVAQHAGGARIDNLGVRVSQVVIYCRICCEGT